MNRKKLFLRFVGVALVMTLILFIVGERSIAYYAGMFVGIVTVWILIVFFSWVVKKFGGRFGTGNSKDAYDERQLLARGKAYQAAFFTMIGYVVMAGVLDEAAGISILMSISGMGIGACLSVAVFAVICILKDAYMSLYENAKGVIMMFSFIGIINLLSIQPVLLHKEPLISDGKLSTICLNLASAVLLLVLAVVLAAKVIYNKNHAEEDEE